MHLRFNHLSEFATALGKLVDEIHEDLIRENVQFVDEGDHVVNFGLSPVLRQACVVILSDIANHTNKHKITYQVGLMTHVHQILLNNARLTTTMQVHQLQEHCGKLREVLRDEIERSEAARQSKIAAMRKRSKQTHRAPEPYWP